MLVLVATRRERAADASFRSLARAAWLQNRTQFRRGGRISVKPFSNDEGMALLYGGKELVS